MTGRQPPPQAFISAAGSVMLSFLSYAARILRRPASTPSRMKAMTT
jgi:hypothetical protein